MNKRTIFVAALILLVLSMVMALVMYLLANWNRSIHPEENIVPSDVLVGVGEPAPDFSAVSTDGQSIQLSQYLGQPVLLYFFGDNEFDPSFHVGLRSIQTIYASYWEKGLAVIAVDYYGRTRNLEWAQDYLETTFPVVIDENQAVASNFMVHMEPHAFFIDCNGVVQRRLDGQLSEDRVENAVRPLFAKPEKEGFNLMSLFSPRPTTPPAVGINPGQEAPNFQLSELDGETIQLSDLRGMPVLLYFFYVSYDQRTRNPGPDSITDLVDLPIIQQVYARHWEEGLAALGVTDGIRPYNPTVIRAAVQKAGTTFPILLDSDFQVRTRYMPHGKSTVYFIASDGVILKVIQHRASEAEYEAGVKLLFEYRDAHPGSKE